MSGLPTQKPHSKPDRRNHAIQAWSFILLICAALFSVTAWRILHAYDLQIRSAQVITADLARSLADKAHSTIHSTTMIVSDIVERLENDGDASARSARMHRLIVNRVADKQSLTDIVIVSATGEGIATTLEPMPKINVADREYFIHHRDDADKKPFIGHPFRNRGEGRWSIPVSRRVDNADGSFAGVVVALIDCEAVGRFYRDFDIGEHGIVQLLNEDATLLVRQPPIPGMIGQNQADSPFMQDYYEHGPTGTSEHLTQSDQAAWLGSFRKVDDYHLVIFVLVGKTDILKAWRDDANTAAVVAVIISGVLSIFGWWLAREFRLRDETDEAVRQSEQRYRLLADHSTDVIMQLGVDGKRHYVSPAAARVFGYEPQELIDGHPRDTVHPEDWPDVAASMAMMRTTRYARPITYRVRRKDGVYIWVETQGRRLDGEEGSIVTIRDISNRKRIETLLHEANNRMQQIVMKDGLTGAMNRRGLDMALDKECRRATRQQTSIAVLIIDVDGMKEFNDRYGHSAGDTCLAAIAEAIGQQARRAADMVARYGGEEFAVLLPDVDADGAAAKAEQIREAVQSLGIPHADNLASVVTVSIGVTVGRPLAGERNKQALLQNAYDALHQAKLRGRNSISACSQSARPDLTLQAHRPGLESNAGANTVVELPT